MMERRRSKVVPERDNVPPKILGSCSIKDNNRRLPIASEILLIDAANATTLCATNIPAPAIISTDSVLGLVPPI